MLVISGQDQSGKMDLNSKASWESSMTISRLVQEKGCLHLFRKKDRFVMKVLNCHRVAAVESCFKMYIVEKINNSLKTASLKLLMKYQPCDTVCTVRSRSVQVLVNYSSTPRPANP